MQSPKKFWLIHNNGTVSCIESVDYNDKYVNTENGYSWKRCILFKTKDEAEKVLSENIYTEVDQLLEEASNLIYQLENLDNKNFEKELQKYKRQLENEIDKIDEEISNIRSTTLLTCRCGLSSPVYDLVEIVHYWYERPYSCTAGDTWHYSYSEWQCSCGLKNSLDEKEIKKFRKFFKEEKKCYDR